MNNVDICNRALGVIGHDRTIESMSETTTEGLLCAKFYPAARDNVLAAYDWEFAAVETEVNLNDDTTSWAIPAGCVKVVAVTDPDGRVLRTVRRGTNLLITRTGAATATVRYTSNAITSFEASLPHLVAEAIVYELAALLFGPMVGNVQDAQGTALYTSYMQLASGKLQAAISAEDAEHAFMGGARNAADEKKTEIVNRAIAKLGGETVVTDFQRDASPVAARARLLFPASLNRVLRMKDWDFAAVERTMTLAWDDAAGYSRFQIPPDCARISETMDERRNPVETTRNQDFLMIRARGGNVILRYLSRDTDLALAPEDFLDLLALDLAEKLAPTVLRDPKSVAAISQQLRLQFGETDRNEANETAYGGDWRNPFIAARN